jgi:hypothetical protein
VVLWGFTAILGKVITLPALALVWWRMVMVVGVAAMFCAAWTHAPSRFSAASAWSSRSTG